MLVTEILEEIRKDVASFADPGTHVEITDRTLAWVRSRTRYTAHLIKQADGFPAVEYQGSEFSYQSFIASTALADLKDLAHSILTQVQVPPRFVQASAWEQPKEGESGSVAIASDLILKETVEPGALPLAATRVLFVHGNAGTGKTSVLAHVTKKQAERYISGETATLFLYLDAQGKGLVQLEDVMARALQDLRARFTYHSVAALTRRHCVVPIVDGFDELIGPSSAREAFTNLSQFLAQLECSGAVVASSRSAFIDYRTLHERAAEVARAQQLSYEIRPVEIREWSEPQVQEFADGRITDPSLRRRISELFHSPVGQLLRKPFFLDQVCNTLEQGGNFNETEDLTRQVMDAALAREADKLKDRHGNQLLSLEQHRTFCEALADEMWAQAKPELDCEAVRLLAEITADDFGLSPQDRKTLVDRSVAHGLLVQATPGDSEKRVFEHELFRFEFQASSLARFVAARNQTTRDYLLRAQLPLDVVTRVPSYQPKESAIAETVTFLGELAIEYSGTQYAPSNAGSLAAALMKDRVDLQQGLVLNSFYIRGADLGKCQLRDAKIVKCLLERDRLADTALLNCKIEDSKFIACIVGPGTRLDGTTIDPSDFLGIMLESNNAPTTEIYDPTRIREILKTCGADVTADTEETGAPLSKDTPERIALVERLLKHARTHYYISRQEPWFLNNLANNAHWNWVEQALQKRGLLENVRLAKSGKPETFLKLTAAPDVILQARVKPSASNPRVAAFWEDLVE